MRVLFAVSNEEVSEAIVKRYQKDFKEIISYKNVYYFNAIIKELQKDKNYDRIVISEELEAFTNTQYSQIDKFIFDKLDNISDEASNLNGEDIPIILICSDRREKGEDMLVKLFGIGIYNALLGNDRSVSNVCQLLNRPRLKKDAKVYYDIDAGDVTYQAENENDVSEVEIQNILAHYKRLGKDEKKYVESFDNIASQYNDTQLRIISKFLPLNVRAVLEEQSPKYQQLISYNNRISDDLRKPKVQSKEPGTSEKLLNSKNNEKILSKPVVIPSSVDKTGAKKFARVKNEARPIVPPTRPVMNNQRPAEPIVRPEMNQVQERPNIRNEQTGARTLSSMFEEENEDIALNNTNINANNNRYENQNNDSQNNAAEDNSLSEIDKLINEEENKQNVNTTNENIQEPEMATPQEQQEVKPKRGRGRPRKNPLPDPNEPPKPKRGRGRPRKNPLPVEEVNTAEPEGAVLPGVENNEEPKETILPGLEEDQQEESVGATLPGVGEPEDDVLPGPSKNEDDEREEAKEEYLKEQQESNYNNYNNNQYDNSYNSQYNNQYNSNNQFENNSYNNSYNSNSSYNNDSYSNGYGSNSLQNTNTEYEDIDISALLTSNKKVACFVGTSKNGTSFIVNNLADVASKMGIDTAILDTTKNRNSYYIYTKNDENLRKTAMDCIPNLLNDNANGIKVENNLTVYTSLPDESEGIENAGAILQTLLQKHSLILIDCDFETPIQYFAKTQEIYLVQSFDILTIQPLTAFLRELKSRNVLDPDKLRIVLNKALKLRGVNDKTIIGGMAFYNDPAMSFMTELFDKDTIRYITVPFSEEVYGVYLENIINCEVSTKRYPKNMVQIFHGLSNMVYPMVSSGKSNYVPPTVQRNANENQNNVFSSSMNSTLDRMKRKF